MRHLASYKLFEKRGFKLTQRQRDLFDFVKEWHGDQVRKYTGDPYWTHLLSVAERVYPYASDMVEVALCHDIIEDTDCTYEQLHDHLLMIGYKKGEAKKIVDGVRSLTDIYTPEAYPNMKREVRKQKEAERLWKIPSKHQTVKYCDLIDNGLDIAKHDRGFGITYYKEKQEIMRGMRNGNGALLSQVNKVLKSMKDQLDV